MKGNVMKEKIGRVVILVVGLAVLALAANAGTVVTCEYRGSVGAVSHYNGPAGLGQFAVYGGAADAGDGSLGTGLYYKPVATFWGASVAGAFTMRPFEDGCGQGGTVLGVQLGVMIFGGKPFEVKGIRFENDKVNSLKIEEAEGISGGWCSTRFAGTLVFPHGAGEGFRCWDFAPASRDSVMAGYWGVWALPRAELCTPEVGCGEDPNIYLAEWRLWVRIEVP